MGVEGWRYEKGKTGRAKNREWKNRDSAIYQASGGYWDLQKQYGSSGEGLGLGRAGFLMRVTDIDIYIYIWM